MMSLFQTVDPLFALVPLAMGSAAIWQISEPVQAASVKPAPKAKQTAAGVTSWEISVVVDLKRVAAMQAGWDGVGSVPIGKNVLRNARSLLSSALLETKTAVAPSIVPGGDGSIQLEWHEKHGELEFLLEPDGLLSIWGRDHRNGFEFEGDGEAALALFYRWAPWIAARRDNALDVSPATKSTFIQLAA